MAGSKVHLPRKAKKNAQVKNACQPLTAGKHMEALKEGREKGLGSDWRAAYNSSRDVVVWICPNTGKAYDRMSKALHGEKNKGSSASELSSKNEGKRLQMPPAEDAFRSHAKNDSQKDDSLVSEKKSHPTQRQLKIGATTDSKKAKSTFRLKRQLDEAFDSNDKGTTRKKSKSSSMNNDDSPLRVSPTKKKRGPGRPPKLKKKGRGRPRKVAIHDQDRTITGDFETKEASLSPTAAPKRMTAPEVVADDDKMSGGDSKASPSSP
ncbi:unnamed protein product [Cylindrotheca closterium]|uniref:Uncharacterized protein n=1 Tax=Cylindrotheca closterium TaxID=2856 RepID=A0AAD2FPM7_9STRA|nr:unnamed protein product [Cylindrotheca closterium]